MKSEPESDITGVPLLDLKAQLDTIGPEIRAAVERVIASQICINGPEVEAFEKEILEYCRMDGAAVGVSSGTDALLAALMALGVGPGDEVVTTPFTFFATAGAVHRVGARPVFADILPGTYNIDPAAVRAAMTPKTKVIIPVHLYGQCADMDAILAAAGSLPVIEDAAQAIGAEYKGRRAGSMGTVGCFSFFPSKNLGALGDAGMIVTKDKELGGRIRAIRTHGEAKRYHHTVVGGNFRLDAIQAAALRAKLPRLDGWSAARAKNAARYAELFAQSGLLGESVASLPVVKESRHIYNQYVICARDRDGLVEFLQKQAHVGCAVYYPVPLHLQECFAYAGYKKGDMPVSEKAAGEVLALPVYPELTEAQQRYVVASIGKYYGR